MKRIIIISFMIVLSTIMNTKILTAQEPNQTSDTTITLKVKGITCPHDCTDISENVELKQGIIDCKADGKPAATTTFSVTYKTSLLTVEDIIKAIEDTPGCENPNNRPYKAKVKKK